MTSCKHVKQLVRARMAATGETYTVAGRSVGHSPRSISRTRSRSPPMASTANPWHPPDGERLLSGVGTPASPSSTPGQAIPSANCDDDGRRRRWDPLDNVCVVEHRSSLRRIAAVAYTPDGTRTLESGQGPQVLVRDVDGGVDSDVIAGLDTGAPGVIGLALLPDHALVATAGYDGTIGLWSCDTWELLRTLPVTGVYALAFSPDTRRLAQTGADGKVRIRTLR